jgi:RNA polymerase sigma factor (sigma-70 family)
MAERLPPELAALLSAPDSGMRDAAWEEFISLHSRLLLQAARSLGAQHDPAMDRYTYMLERLRERDFHRLRSYVPDGRTKFTTWLVVVGRRLCLDHYRERYGRPDNPGVHESAGRGARSVRRQLADDYMERIDPELVSAPAGSSPEAELDSSQRRECLQAAIATLEPGDQLILKLRFEDELSAREIARVIGWPTPFHVYRRLNALLRELRRRLLAGGIEGADA